MCFPYSAVFPSLSYLQLYEAFTFLKSLGAVILVHAENGDLIAQVSELSFLLGFVSRHKRGEVKPSSQSVGRKEGRNYPVGALIEPDALHTAGIKPGMRGWRPFCMPWQSIREVEQLPDRSSPWQQMRTGWMRGAEGSKKISSESSRDERSTTV